MCTEICRKQRVYFNPILRKKYLQTSFQVGMDLKNVQKQGRDENTQEDYPTFAEFFFPVIVP